MRTLAIITLLFVTTISFGQRNPFRNLTERNGQIGIGTTHPDATLTVKGKIHTQEVLVDLNGAVAPDYVFEDYFLGRSTLKSDYSFPSLRFVGEYVELHHHLPGIPSAEELEVEGMELKEMNLLLLQKIEELTLYTLEQQKEIDRLKSRLTELEN